MLPGGITCPICRLVITNKVLTVLGKMWRMIITGMDRPAILGEGHEVQFLDGQHVPPGSSGQNRAQTVRATARMMFSMPAPRMVTIIIATRMVGEPEGSVGSPHYQVVQPSSPEAGDQPEDGADEGPGAQRYQADEQGRSWRRRSAG